MLLSDMKTKTFLYLLVRKQKALKFPSLHTLDESIV